MASAGTATATCNARRKGAANKGLRCTHPAGWGTDHPGVGACKFHGGLGKFGAKAAARPALALLVGAGVDVSPMEALLMCVNISAAELAYFNGRLAELDPEHIFVNQHETKYEVLVDLLGRQESQLSPTEIKVKAKELNIWLRSRHDAMDRVARFSKMALDAGCEERMVSLAESVGRKIADALGTLLQNLHLTPEQQSRAPQLVRQCIAQLEVAA